MGNSHTKIENLDPSRVTEIATEACGAFSTEFSLAFKDCLIENVKFSNQTIPKNQLREAPLPTQIIKRGELYKQGNNVKNWKKRYFTAMNMAENYVIIYSEDDAGTNMRGKISCYGYRVEAFSPEETKKYGQHGFKLKPIDEHNRIWYFRAENVEEQHEWMEVFANACRKTLLVQNVDILNQNIFKSAYRNTLGSYGYFGVLRLYSTESDMIEALINQILRREILDGYISESTKGLKLDEHDNDNGNGNGKNPSKSETERKNLIQAVDREVAKIVRPIAASAWRINEHLLESRDVTKEDIQTNLRLIEETENQIYDILSTETHLIKYNIFESLKSPLERILVSMVDFISQAFEEGIQGFSNDARARVSGLLIPNLYDGSDDDYDLISSNSLSSVGSESNHKPHTRSRSLKTRDILLPLLEHFIDEMNMMDGNVEQVHAGALETSQKILWKAFTDDLATLTEIPLFQSSGISTYTVYIDVMDSLRRLIRNAIFTFKEYCIVFIKESISSYPSTAPDYEFFSNPEYQRISSAVQNLPQGMMEGMTEEEFERQKILREIEREKMRELYLKAVESQLNEQEIKFTEALRQVLFDLKADTKITFRDILRNILEDIVEATIQENLIIPVTELMIGDIQVSKFIPKSINHLLHPKYLCERSIRREVMKFVDDLIEPLYLDASHKIDAMADACNESLGMKMRTSSFDG